MTEVQHSWTCRFPDLIQIKCFFLVVDTHKHKDKHKDKEYKHKDYKKDKERDKFKHNNR